MKKGHRAISYLYEATEKNRISAVALTVMEIILSLVGIGFAMAMRSALDGAANQDNLKSRLLRHLLHSDYTQTEAVHTGECTNR